MKFIILLFLVLTMSCGVLPPHYEKFLKNPLHDWIHDPVDKDPRRHVSSHPDFAYYIQRFEALYGHSIAHIPINFADDLNQRMGRDVAGVCWSWSSGHREIEINPDYWPDFDDYQREQLIFHELGHCALGKGHNDSMDGSCPVTMMRSWMFNWWEIDNCYIPQYDYYLDELL